MADTYVFNKADGTPWFSVFSLETDGPNNLSTPRAIIGVGSNYFRVYGDVTARFVTGFGFNVIEATSLNGSYTVFDSIYDANTDMTTINVNELVAPSSPLPYGAIQYTTPTPHTSLSIPGKRALEFGFGINNNMLRLLDNFSGTVPPSFPTSGQLWFDSGSSEMKVYNGSTFMPLGGGTPAPAAPAYEEFVGSGAAIFNTTVTTQPKNGNVAYLQVFVNGVFQQEGSAKQYTVTGINQITFTAQSIPVIGDDIVIYSFS